MADQHLYIGFICIACCYEVKFQEPKPWEHAEAVGSAHKCDPNELKGAFAPWKEGETDG